MKRILFTLLTAITIAACNNNKTAETPAGSSATTTSPEVKDKPAESGRGCSSFVWFKEGTVMEFQTSDATGKIISHATTSIDKVHQDGGATVADFTITYGNTGKSIHATYRCEGNRIYADMKGIFNDLVGNMEKTGMEVEVNNAYITFPWDMKEGDKLDEAAFEIKTKKQGKEFMNMKRIIKDRTVEKNESVTVPAGTFNCLKLTETWTLEMSMMGRSMPSQVSKSVEWFDPKAGIVKTETYNDKDKVQSTSELVSLKR